MVTVLVAVYNGEKYLADLLNSIINQTYKDIRIVVSDDLSSDKSPEIIKEFFEKYPDKIIPVFRKTSSGSAKAHFIYLLEEFSDDVWFPDKIEKTLSLMLKGDNNKPRLVHTDCVLADEFLNITHKSFKKFSMVPTVLPFSKLLAENSVQGASAMVNKALVKEAVPYSEDMVMHDRWVALIASALGEIDYLDEPTFFYRQHSKNQIGASKKPSSLSYIKMRLKTNIAKDINLSRRQAGLLLKRIGDKMPNELKLIAEEYANSEKLSKLERIRILKRRNIMPDSALKKIKFLLWG